MKKLLLLSLYVGCVFGMAFVPKAHATCYVCTVRMEDEGYCQLSAANGAHCYCQPDPYTPACWMSGYCLFGTCEPLSSPAAYYTTDPWTTDRSLVQKIGKQSPILAHAVWSFQRSLAEAQPATPEWFGKFFKNGHPKNVTNVEVHKLADGSWTFAVVGGPELRIQGKRWAVRGAGKLMAGTVTPDASYADEMKTKLAKFQLSDPLK